MTDRPRRRLGALFYALLSTLLLAGLAMVAFWQVVDAQKERVVDNLDAATEEKVRLGNIVLSLCPAGRPIVDTVTLQDCLEAAQAVTDPAVDQRVQADGISATQVRTIVLQELARFEQRTGRPPTEAEVLDMVRQVYEANKPADGRTPTEGELLAIIMPIVEANRPADGRNGADCDPAVIPECRGPAGPQGISVVRGDFVRIPDGPCVYRITLHNPADGSTATSDAAVPDELCAPPEPPPPTTAPPLPGPPLGGR